MDENKKKEIRWSVFIPAFSFVLIAAIIGIVNNEALTSMSNTFFCMVFRKLRLAVSNYSNGRIYYYLCNYVFKTWKR